MLYEPTLIVERMVVEKDGHTAYDEAFHSGVNVIRGDNSSGKSTILNFVFYGLGGDLQDWSEAALRCSRVYLQVRLNGNVATLARDVTDKPRPPMDIFAGEIDEALRSPPSLWLRLGYIRSDKRESFSQVLFRLMNMPEVANETSGNITINQLLRLLYADQLSPVGNLFKFQGAFDDAGLRDAVGRLLFGAHSAQYYENEQDIRRLGKELDQATGAYRSLLAVAGAAEQGFTYEWIGIQRTKLEAEAKSIGEALQSAERQMRDQPNSTTTTLRGQDSAYSEVVDLQGELGRAQAERDNLTLKIVDSDRFIASLQHKLRALRDSSTVAEVMGEVRYGECPACHAPTQETGHEHACYLCKSPYDDGHERGRITGLINETALQLDQSVHLQRGRQEKVGLLDQRIAQLRERWEKARARLDSLRRIATTEQQLLVRDLNRKAGYVQRALEDLARMEQLANRLRELSELRAALQQQITSLQGENEALHRQQSDRIARASAVVAEEVKELLINDLRRQDIFENPQRVNFSFRENSISVNEQRYFSASSRAILKSSFALALLSAATKLEFMRDPRFCMIDTLENMGVEAIRSKNFQKQILRVSQNAKVDHQIIFATAMLTPELDSDAYTVGRHYTRDEPSLTLLS
ncbi:MULTISPECIES: AAA family ATPase [unclassified Sphingomonas]|jgi:predicted  nucleic acid-binding Zn-ribbon protein|uniref:AAA family ATPase n=1 Tax=unclassified Sphingomonas TaxID=196159 RepID=UPI000829F477|nr:MULTISPECIES: AAA family ATPase [unclassified Sphingomonas]